MVVATYTAKRKHTERVARLLPTLAAASRREPGNISYAAARDLERPQVFTIVEVYVDADAFTAHRQSDHFSSICKTQIMPLLRSRDVVGYEAGDAIA